MKSSNFPLEHLQFLGFELGPSPSAPAGRRTEWSASEGQKSTEAFPRKGIRHAVCVYIYMLYFILYIYTLYYNIIYIYYNIYNILHIKNYILYITYDKFYIKH